MNRPSLRDPSRPDPSRSRTTWLSFAPLIAAALFTAGVLAFLPSSSGGLQEAWADDEAPEAEGIQWVSGFEAGRAAAKRDGKLMFVYFGRHAPR